MSVQSVMPSSHFILCHPLLFPPSIFPSIRVFSNESVLHSRWPKYWSFSLSFQWIFRTDFFYYGISLKSKGLSRVFSNTTVQSINPSALSFLYSPNLKLATGKTIALTRWTFVGKIISLLFNMLSRLVITFLPKSKVKVKSLCFVQLFATPWTVTHQAPPSMGFSRQEYWSGVPLPSLFQLP